MSTKKSCIYPFEVQTQRRISQGIPLNEIISKDIPRYQERCVNLLNDFKPIGPLHSIGLSTRFLTLIARHSAARSIFPYLPSAEEVIMAVKPLVVGLRRRL